MIITRTSVTYPKGYRYTLTIPINSIMDLAGNGINHAYTDTFTIVTRPPIVTATPKGGYYNTSKTVTLTMNELDLFTIPPMEPHQQLAVLIIPHHSSYLQRKL